MTMLDRKEEQRRREATLRGLLAKDEDRWRLNRAAARQDPKTVARNKRAGKKVSDAIKARRQGNRKTWFDRMAELRRRSRPHPAGCKRLVLMRWPDDYDGLELVALPALYVALPEYSRSAIRGAIGQLRKEGLIENLAGPQERECEGFGPFVGKPRYAITEAGLRQRAEWIGEFGG